MAAAARLTRVPQDKIWKGRADQCPWQRVSGTAPGDWSARRTSSVKGAFRKARSGAPLGLASSGTHVMTQTAVGITAVQVSALSSRNEIEVTNQLPIMPTVVESTGAAAPAAGTVIADSGAIAQAGFYEFTIELATDDLPAAAGRFIAVEHRNAANAANVGRLVVPAPMSRLVVFQVTLAASERVRVISGIIATASTLYSAMIMYRRIANIFVGTSGVTTSNGRRLRPGETTGRMQVVGPVYAISPETAVPAQAIELGP